MDKRKEFLDSNCSKEGKVFLLKLDQKQRPGHDNHSECPQMMEQLNNKNHYFEVFLITPKWYVLIGEENSV